MIASFSIFALYATFLQADNSAKQSAEARAIIDQAIEATGGREALARYQQPFRLKRAGKHLSPRGDAAYSATITAQFPDKLRQQTVIGRGRPSLTVLNGADAWSESGAVMAAAGPAGRPSAASAKPGDTETARPPRPAAPPRLPLAGLRPMPPVAAEALGFHLYRQWLTTLLPLDDEKFELAIADDAQVDGRPLSGVRVSHEGRPDVTLYFDRETHLLVRTECKLANVRLEERYADFADLDGLTYPKRLIMFRDGRKVRDVETTEFRFLDQVDDGTFEGPEKTGPR